MVKKDDNEEGRGLETTHPTFRRVVNKDAECGAEASRGQIDG